MATKTKMLFNNDLVAYTTDYGLLKYGLVIRGNTETNGVTYAHEENCINVRWYPEGYEETVRDDQVVLMDRTFIAGDKVFKMDLDSKRQYGYVDSVEKQATVRIFNTTKVLEDVNSSDLTNIRKFDNHSIVLYDSTWVGVVLGSAYNVTFATCDGFKFVIYNPKRRYFSVIELNDVYGINENLFYPGIRMLTCVENLLSLRFVHSNELSKRKLSVYLKKKRMHELFEICVTKTVVATVSIKWKFQTSIENRPLDDDFPNTLISGKYLSRLKSLDLFNPVCIELGNQYWYKTKKTDSFKSVKSYRKSIIEDFCNIPGLLLNKPLDDALALSKEPLDLTSFLGKVFKSVWKSNFRMPKIYKWTKSGTGKHSLTILKRNRVLKSFITKRKKLNVPLSMKKSTNVVVEACKSKHLINVIWQDGTKELIPATDLSLIVGVLIPEFFPGNFVTKKQNDSPTVYGVVEYVDYATRIACVQWFNDEKLGYLSMPTLLKKSQHSVYDLYPHSEFFFDYHKIVLHLASVDDENVLKFTVALLLRVEPDGKISLLLSNGDMMQCWPQELWNPKLSDGSIFYDNVLLNKYLVDISKWNTIDLIPSTSSSTEELETPSEISISCVQIFSNTTIKDGLPGALLPNDTLSGVSMQITEDMHTNSPGISKHLLHQHYSELQSANDGSSALDQFDENNIYQMLMELPDIFKKQIENDTEEENKKEEKANAKIKEKSKEEKDEDEENKKEEKANAKIKEKSKEEKDEDEEKKEEKENEEEEEEYNVIVNSDVGVFEMLESCTTHKYISEKNVLCTQILNVINKEVKILQDSLPVGIWVKMFEERMDLLSVMIRGPENTPYAGGLYLFDIKLPAKYPFEPPQCHYYSFCDDRLNPNLYVDGKVCLSLLGTWYGEENEKWSSKYSNLLQVLVSIQGLIFVSEPYYNEPGLESLRMENMTKESSRVYNELVLMKVLQSMTSLLSTSAGPNPSVSFVGEIIEHFKNHGPKMVETIEHWIKNSGKDIGDDDARDPGYPLLPLSAGFCLSVANSLNEFKVKLSKLLSP